MLSLTAILRAESFCLSRASCCLRKRFCSLRSQIFFTVKTEGLRPQDGC